MSEPLPVEMGREQVVECPHCAAKLLVSIRTQARVTAAPTGDATTEERDA